ncbi:MAG: GNAT family N-acetyltransferase [Halobacteriales archaeon]
MPGALYLESDDVTLRTIEEEDLPFLRDTINDPAVRRHLARRGPYNMPQERAFFENVVTDDDTLNLLVCRDGESAGTVGLQTLTSPDGSSEIGIFLAEAFWGEGVGTEAARLVTDHAFRERDRHRVEARVIEGNAASRALFETLGFRHESTMREAAFHDGEYVDMHWYAVLKEEWLPGS